MRRPTSIVFLLCVLPFLGATASPCAQEMQGEDPDNANCIDGLQNSLTDRQMYWFGTSFTDKCPMSTWFSGDVECSNPLGVGGQSVDDLTAIKGDAIDRLMNVTYVSKPGSYVGCDHTFVQTTEKRIPIDPLSDDTITAWDARDMPEVSWRADEGKQYTLIVFDIAVNILHGLYINIEGNDMSTATVLDPYHGPLNPQARANLYMFLLYEQQINNMSLPAEVSNALFPTSWGQARYKLGELTPVASLRGPISISNVLAWYDRMSVSIMEERGIISNCVPFVEEAYMSQKHDVPFLPKQPDLSVNLRIQIHNQPLQFEYCCKTHKYEERSFFLDPENPNVTAAEARTSNMVTVHASMNKLFPNASVDFKDKHYTLLMVDVDVPNAQVGTSERPLVHWLAINNRMDANGSVVEGTQLQNRFGPMPPDNNPHTYYFMLYEQMTGSLQLNSTLDYTGNCTGISRTCLFNVTDFVADNDLHLVGLSWMTVANDDYVNYTYELDQKDACPTFPCPKKEDTSSATTVMCSLWIIIATALYGVVMN